MKTKQLTLCALFASLTAICAQIVLPLPFTPVPVNLATLVVLMAGGLLGAKNGLISMIVYLCVGAFGIPVFANWQGGVAVLIGPTGGYLVGYPAAAFLTGSLCHPVGKGKKNDWLAMSVGMVACYLLGTLWFVYLTKNSFSQALWMCVLPFLPGDALKIATASLLCNKLKKTLPAAAFGTTM